MDAFRNALGDEQLQQHIFSRKVTTLTEAITLATEMEAFLDWQAQQRKNKQGVVDVMSVEQPPPPQSVKNKNTSTSLENTVSVVIMGRRIWGTPGRLGLGSGDTWQKARSRGQ